MIGQHNVLFTLILFIVVSREMNYAVFIFLQKISNENLKFCTKMYKRSTGKVNELIATISNTFIHLTQLFFAKWDCIVIFKKIYGYRRI